MRQMKYMENGRQLVVQRYVSFKCADICTQCLKCIWAVTWQNQQSDCGPSEDSDQPGHLPSLIRVFAVHMKKPWVLSYPLSAQQRLQSDLADAQADLNLRWAHTRFVGFVMLWLICTGSVQTAIIIVFIKATTYNPNRKHFHFLADHQGMTQTYCQQQMILRFRTDRSGQTV